MTVPNAQRVTRYLTALVRWLLVLGGVFALTVLAGEYVIDNVLTKVYKASALIKLPDGDLVTPTAPSSIMEPEPFQPECENTMTSPEFLLAVVRKLGLDKEWAKRIYKTDDDSLPDVDALTRMERLLKIEVRPGTHLVAIKASSDVPEEASAIANAVAELYQTTRGAGSATSPVQIVERAVTPTEPSEPRRKVDFVLTLVIAAMAGVTAASFVEIIFLFVRAGERMDN